MRKMGIGLGVGINRSNYAQGIFNAYSARVVADGGVVEGGSCVDAVSSLLQSASLLLIPSGYKANKLYSEIPTNGNGDLTWTRTSTAIRTNSSGLLESMATGVPRLSYMYGSCPSALLEPQRTNLALYSAQFDDATWIKNGTTITANTTTSPDGSTNADTLSGDGSLGLHELRQSINFVSGTTYTLSVYAKKNTNNFIQLIAGSTGFGLNVWANFDLNSGVVGSVGSSTTASIQSIGNGWYRCIITGTASITGSSLVVPYLVSSASSVRGETNTLATSLYLYGFQVEAGAYPTTYIPTTSGATATRVADSCYKTGISSLIGQTEGTLYWDGTAVQGNYNQLMFIKDSSANQFIGMTVGLGVIYGEIYNSGYVHLYSYSIGANDTRFKMALAYKTNSFAFYVNGVQVASSTTGTTPTSFDDFYLGNTNNLRDFTCQVNKAVLFPTRLTNAELATLTT